MRIGAPRLESDGSRVRAVARVEWEDCDRPAGNVVFETEAEAAEDFEASPEAFAVICALQARRDGERRLRVEAPLCPQLRDGLDGALSILEWWFPAVNRPTRIEAAGGFRVRRPPSPRAASLVSGGVDSIRLIQDNRRLFPPDHPRSLKDGLFLFGFSNRPDMPRSAQENFVERQRRSVEDVCRLARLRLLPVRVDLNVLGDDRLFVRTQSHGARLAAIGHLFRSLSTASIAASFFAADLFPWGSHPILDPLFGSSSLEVRHEGVWNRRIESVRAILDWPEILPFLMVCGEAPVDKSLLNCGRCEKCVRTLLEFEAVGSPEAAKAFAPREITAADVERLAAEFWVNSYWRDLVEPLRERGRPDLSVAAGRLADRSARHRDWIEERGWKGWLRGIDRRHFQGRLAAASRGFRRFA